jgi:hypothetical protein
VALAQSSPCRLGAEKAMRRLVALLLPFLGGAFLVPPILPSQLPLPVPVPEEPLITIFDTIKEVRFVVHDPDVTCRPSTRIAKPPDSSTLAPMLYYDAQATVTKDLDNAVAMIVAEAISGASGALISRGAERAMFVGMKVKERPGKVSVRGEASAAGAFFGIRGLVRVLARVGGMCMAFEFEGGSASPLSLWTVPYTACHDGENVDAFEAVISSPDRIPGRACLPHDSACLRPASCWQLLGVPRPLALVLSTVLGSVALTSAEFGSGMAKVPDEPQWVEIFGDVVK